LIFPEKSISCSGLIVLYQIELNLSRTFSPSFIICAVFVSLGYIKTNPNKSVWIHSFYNKLANDLVFDNKKMLGTGFKPSESLNSLFIKRGL